MPRPQTSSSPAQDWLAGCSGPLTGFACPTQLGGVLGGPHRNRDKWAFLAITHYRNRLPGEVGPYGSIIPRGNSPLEAVTLNCPKGQRYTKHPKR